jgi:hypothetical protein
VPERHFAALDAASLTGLVSVADLPRGEAIAVTRALASGCLATAFMWLQHQGALRGVMRGRPSVSRRWIGPLSTGEIRAGLATTALRPPAPLFAKRDGLDWRLTGEVPWVTGWGAVTVLRIAALDGDVVRDFLMDADPSGSLLAHPVDLIAAQASRTARLILDNHPVSADRELSETSLNEWAMASETRLNGNGALALGIAQRAAGLAQSDALMAEVDSATEALISASEAELPQARGTCSYLAVRAVDILALSSGSRSVVHGGDAERLGREARFCLIAGTTPRTRSAILARFIEH